MIPVSKRLLANFINICCVLNILLRSVVKNLGVTSVFLVANTCILVSTQPAFAQARQVTGVRLDPTDSGLEVILETPSEEQPQVFKTRFGRTLAIDIPNTQLRLPEDKGFRENNPASGVAQVTVVQQNPNSVRVTVTGTEAVPSAEVIESAQGLALSVRSPSAAAETLPAPPTPETPQAEPPAPTAPSAAGEEAIELVVPAVGEEGYLVDEATTGTRTETPILDVPQSIEVVPEEVIEDQDADTLDDITRNVGGFNQFSSPNYQDFALRGFRLQEDSIIYNGLRGNPFDKFAPLKLNNVEQVDVLKGPASVLYGQLEPGGLVNIVTKKPQEDPFTEVKVAPGSQELAPGVFDQLELQLDSTGPLNESETLLYRLILAYEDSNSFRNFQELKYRSIYPSLTWRIGEATTLDFTAIFYDEDREGQRDRGIAAPGGDVSAVPIDFTTNEPGDIAKSEGSALQLDLEHEFSEDLELEAAARYAQSDYTNNYHEPRGFLDDGRTIKRQYRNQVLSDSSYTFNVNLIGNLETGPVAHKILLGADATRTTSEGSPNRFASPISEDGTVPPLDIFDPIYGQADVPEDYVFDSEFLFESEQFVYGVYAQDQIEFSPQWKGLVGVRYDSFDQEFTEFTTSGDLESEQEQSDSDLTLRGGIVYQPSDNLSFYTSYSEGFSPQDTSDQTPEQGGPFDPTTSEQIEAGVKAFWLEDRLSTTLAFYRITKQNILVADPEDPDRSIQLGETESKGIELSITGLITENWRVIANYAYNDARVTEDTNPDNVGELLPNAPKNSAGLWTRYDFPNSNFGVGGGLTYVAERETDISADENVNLPSYVKADLALFYTVEDLEVAVNVKNVFDEVYFVGGFGETGVFPGAPRTITVNAFYTF
ncbi:MAG: hypothetical protein BRC47_00890 [Cyanobacteria bacterium QS_7_48_42]|nr:MAG: hypothetical protein BRC34_00535 [Cyanobacteria bacterium QH_1_48_107]PSP05977.1 MAG: hypothetical protein BRC47_00890 [Cyanobacteria bacterium QS_7_48_42]PSP08007.1 MAG: hypothetical protein BRC54_02650 [Cyanobacteria bacterium SW_7_48_12]